MNDDSGWLLYSISGLSNFQWGQCIFIVVSTYGLDVDDSWCLFRPILG